MNQIVARFAPSPTGFLHIGGIRTALINYIYIEQAKIHNPDSKFLLRIEDTDSKRSKKEYIDSIINGLNWIGIEWDDDLVMQSQRFDRHKKIAFQLLEKNQAYKCICSPEDLEKKRKENLEKKLSLKRLCETCEDDTKIQSLVKDYCIRIKTSTKGNTIINDKIQKKINLKNIELDNFILLRKDNTPTYMLSVVVDDHDMGVNTIIRGSDHINNTFRQIQIYNKLNWKIPEYAHLPLIHGMDGLKLSKRHGAVDINDLNKKGYLPQSIINNLILLGWSPKNKDEIISMTEIKKIFDIKELSKSASIFNYDKLDFFNNHYLKSEENYKYFEKFCSTNANLKIFIHQDSIKMKKIFNIYKKSLKNYNELENISKIYYDQYFKTNKNEKLNKEFNIILNDFIEYLNKIKNWSVENLNNTIKSFIKDNNLKFVTLGQPLRLILTNLKDGPSIGDILYILGKEETFLRMNNYISSR